MINEISRHIKTNLNNYSEDDGLLLNNKLYQINKENFFPINTSQSEKSIAFIDGGQAQILSAGNFSLGFIRVAGVIFKDNKKPTYLVANNKRLKKIINFKLKKNLSKMIY